MIKDGFVGLSSVNAVDVMLEAVAEASVVESECVDCPPFDEAKFRLSKLCKNSHEWGNTGKSLKRVRRDGSLDVCTQCKRDGEAKRRNAIVAKVQSGLISFEFSDVEACPIFDTTRFKLGSLCKRGHEWGRTAQSLRRVKNGQCEQCSLDKQLKEKQKRQNKKQERRDRIQELIFQFNIDDLYSLGRICHKGHSFEGTEFSLIYKKTRQCLRCLSERFQEKYEPTRIENRKKQQEKEELIRHLAEKLGIDTSKFKLSLILCSNNHIFENSGCTLRYLGGQCVQCVSDVGKAKYTPKPRVKIPFPGTPYYLAKICDRGHDFEGTGLSLRKNRHCVECRKQTNRECYHSRIRTGVYKLGGICYRGHDFEGSGQSLRLQSSNQCVECLRLTSREREEKRDKSKRRISRLLWIERNREKIRKYNRERSASNYHRRRAKKKGQGYLKYSKNDLLERLKLFGSECSYCEKPLSLDEKYSVYWDHFTAIDGGGMDCLANLLPCCQSCSSQKGPRNVINWFRGVSFFTEARWAWILKIMGLKTTHDLGSPAIQLKFL